MSACRFAILMFVLLLLQCIVLCAIVHVHHVLTKDLSVCLSVCLSVYKLWQVRGNQTELIALPVDIKTLKLASTLMNPTDPVSTSKLT